MLEGKTTKNIAIYGGIALLGLFYLKNHASSPVTAVPAKIAATLPGASTGESSYKYNNTVYTNGTTYIQSGTMNTPYTPAAGVNLTPAQIVAALTQGPSGAVR